MTDPNPCNVCTMTVDAHPQIVYSPRKPYQAATRVNPKPTCTLRDVAHHLGISIATVSRALRQDPRITEKMQLKVVKAANKLGYRRDPKLAQLMSHIRATKQRAFQGTLAWLTDHDLGVPEENKAHQLFWQPAVRRAHELGYQLECYPNVHPTHSARIERRLHAQGIQGIVFQQFKSEFQLADWGFNWRRFAVIHNGSCQTPQHLDSVDGDDTANCANLFKNIAARGYQRIGICTPEPIERAMNFSLSTALRRFTLWNPETPEIPSCLLPDLSLKSARLMGKWIQRHRVDCIVSQVRGMKELIESIGLRVPEDIGLAWQGVNPNNANSGIWQREDIIASVLVETLIASVEQGRIGLPLAPRLTLIQGTWHQGSTTV